MSRSFEVVKMNNKSPKKGGRYLSETPSSAVRKAFNELMRHAKKSKSKSKSKGKGKKMVLTLRETTAGCDKKEYTYKVTRVVLKEPRVVDLKNGDQIVYRYDTKVERVEM